MARTGKNVDEAISQSIERMGDTETVDHKASSKKTRFPMIGKLKLFKWMLPLPETWG